MTATEVPATHRRFAGIDPSLTATGICVLMQGEPLIRTIATTPKSHSNTFERLDYIVHEVGDILFGDCGFGRDDVICIERPFVSPKHMNAQQNLLVLSYLIRQCLYKHRMPWREVSPAALKKFVCGKGTAEKSMMLMRVYQHWRISANDDNQADAVGLAYMAKAMEAVKSDVDQDVWQKYQLDTVRDILTKG